MVTEHKDRARDFRDVIYRVANGYQNAHCQVELNVAELPALKAILLRQMLHFDCRGKHDQAGNHLHADVQATESQTHDYITSQLSIMLDADISASFIKLSLL